MGQPCEKSLIVGNWTSNLSLQNRCTNHLHDRSPHVWQVVFLRCWHKFEFFQLSCSVELLPKEKKKKQRERVFIKGEKWKNIWNKNRIHGLKDGTTFYRHVQLMSPNLENRESIKMELSKELVAKHREDGKNFEKWKGDKGGGGVKLRKSITERRGAYLKTNGAYANMAAKYSGQCKRPPRDGFPRFLLAYFLKVNGPQRHFSWGILHNRHWVWSPFEAKSSFLSLFVNAIADDLWFFFCLRTLRSLVHLWCLVPLAIILHLTDHAT